MNTADESPTTTRGPHRPRIPSPAPPTLTPAARDAEGPRGHGGTHAPTARAANEPASRSAWSPRAWAIYLGWIVITLDTSALNLALPSIATQLGAEPSGTSWVVDAYTLPLASLLLVGGTLGDRVGPERLFRVGAIGFAAASVACALSPTLGALIACRAAQGAFAALLLPMMLALAGTSFASPAERAKAVNLMTLFGGAGMAVGPFVGGLLTDTAGWRAVFWLTAPLAIAAAAVVGPVGTRRDTAGRARIDVPGQLAGTLGLVALVAGLIELSRDRGPILAGTLLAAGIVLLGAFVIIERRVAAPMMPLHVFRNGDFSRSVVGGFAFQFGTYGLQFFLALYLQAAWGLPALTAGAILVSFALGTVVTSITINPVLLRRGTRTMILTGAAIATAATVVMLGSADHDRWWLLAVAEFFVGLGAGMYSTALNKTASSALGPRNAGLSSGIYNTARQVGQCVGIAVLGALAALDDTSLGYTVAIALVACCSATIAGTALGARRAATP